MYLRIYSYLYHVHIETLYYNSMKIQLNFSNQVRITEVSLISTVNITGWIDFGNKQLRQHTSNPVSENVHLCKKF